MNGERTTESASLKLMISGCYFANAYWKLICGALQVWDRMQSNYSGRTMKKIAVLAAATFLAFSFADIASAQQSQGGQQVSGKRSCKKLLKGRKGLTAAGKIAAQREFMMQGKCDVVR